MEIGRWFGKHLLNKKRVFNPKETEPNPQVRIWMDCRSCGYTTSILGRVEGIKITEGTGQLQSIADEHYLELGGVDRRFTAKTVTIFGGSDHREFVCWFGDKSGGVILEPTITAPYRPSVKPKDPMRN